MRHTHVAGALLALAATAPGRAGGDEPTPPPVERVVRALAEADPLARGSTSGLLDPGAKVPGGEPSLPLAAIGSDPAQEDVVRDRALRLRVALTRLTWVVNEPGGPTPAKSPMWWLALDELDRGLPRARGRRSSPARSPTRRTSTRPSVRSPRGGRSPPGSAASGARSSEAPRRRRGTRRSARTW